MEEEDVVAYAFGGIGVVFVLLGLLMLRNALRATRRNLRKTAYTGAAVFVAIGLVLSAISYFTWEYS